MILYLWFVDDGMNTHETFDELYNVPWTSAELIVPVIKGVFYCTYIRETSLPVIMLW